MQPVALAFVVLTGSLLAQGDRELAAMERCLAVLPVGAQVAVVMVEKSQVRYQGMEKTIQGLRCVDNRRSVFQIGSITKVFTATLFAQFVQRGQLGLEDPVRKHLPFTPKVAEREGAEATLRQLASHTSGIAHHQPPGMNTHAFFHGHLDEPLKDFDSARFDKYLRTELELSTKPGSRYLYSNLGMSLLGKILSLRSGKSYEALLQEGICAPLGLTSTTIDFAKVGSRVVFGRKSNGKPFPNQDMNALAPSGGIYTSVEDLGAFARAQFDPVDPAIALTQKPVHTLEEGYHVALGWHRVDHVQGWRWLNHNGGIGGYTSTFNVDPMRQRAVAVLCNVMNDDVPGEAVRKLGRELMKELEVQP